MRSPRGGSSAKSVRRCNSRISGNELREPATPHAECMVRWVLPCSSPPVVVRVVDRSAADNAFHVVPSRQCIRHGAPPGCTCAMSQCVLGRQHVGLLAMPRSPKPVAGWRGQTNTLTPRRRDLNRTFMAFKRPIASSLDWPPDKNAIPGTPRDGSHQTPHRGVGHFVHIFHLVLLAVDQSHLILLFAADLFTSLGGR